MQNKPKRSSYAENKAILKEKEAAFLDYCLALMRIRDSKEYLEEYSSFQEFVSAECPFGRAHAYRLIDTAKASLSPPEPGPSNLSHSGDTKTNDSLENKSISEPEPTKSKPEETYKTLPGCVSADKPLDPRAYTPEPIHKPDPLPDVSPYELLEASKQSLITALRKWLLNQPPGTKAPDLADLCKHFELMIEDHLQF